MEAPLRSSISSSRRSAIRCTAGVLAGIALLFGFDILAYRDHRKAVREAEARALRMNPEVSPYPSGERDAEILNHEMLVRAHNPSVVFAGDSVVEAAIDPHVARETWGLPSSTGVRVLALGGSSPETVLKALVRSSWRPTFVLIDLAPRSFLPPEEYRVESMLTGTLLEPGPPANDSLQNPFTRNVEENLGEAVLAVLPTARLGFFERSIVRYARAIQDGFSHGFEAYRGAWAGNVTSLLMEDGSVRNMLLNRTPGIRRFKEEAIRTSLGMFHDRRIHADSSLNRVFSIAQELARDGSSVVLVRMPLSQRLRERAESLHGERFRRIRDRCDPEPRLHYLDMGADPRLADLPFYDGHHREYPEARQGTVHIAELLRPYLPPSLWQE